MCGGPWRNSVYKIDKSRSALESNAVSPACQKQVWASTPLVHTYAVQGCTCRMHAADNTKIKENDLGDCNKLLDGSVHTAAKYSAAMHEGFVLRFSLPQPTSVEALETYVKQEDRAGGYAAPKISIQTNQSAHWISVYKSESLWGQFDSQEHKSIVTVAPAFRFDKWNVHKFDQMHKGVTAIKMELLGEIDMGSHNSFSMHELRIISPNPQHALRVPAVHVGPGKYKGCYQDHVVRDFPIFVGRCNFMTPAECNAMCSIGGHKYYALQFHGECRCADKKWKPRYPKVKDSECNAACNGDISIMCGGQWRNTVYEADPHIGERIYKCKAEKQKSKIGKKKTKHTHTIPGDYVGCYKDSKTDRDFAVNKGPWSDLNPEKCSRMCKHFAYYALQNGKECRCADKLWHAKYGPATDRHCEIACSGDTSLNCGGKLHNLVYKTKPFLPTLKKDLKPQEGGAPLNGIKDLFKNHPGKGSKHAASQDKNPSQKPDEQSAPGGQVQSNPIPQPQPPPPPPPPPEHAAYGHENEEPDDPTVAQSVKPKGGSVRVVIILLIVLGLLACAAAAAYMFRYKWQKVHQQTAKKEKGGPEERARLVDDRDADDDKDPWVEESPASDADFQKVVFRPDDI